ncbi:MAG TPA: LLM class flavin-dependent oxidoreductase [Actinomycetota bacterium]|nr:LLM class flavin-dependent oxidoreductase [Actinomycetota bacterium]
MKIGIVLPLFSGDPVKVRTVASSADELGFDGVFAFDHFFPPGAPPDRPSLEAFATLSSIAARYPHLTLGTLVTRAALRPAGLLAKMAVSLDDMSGGRFVLGIGTGDPIDLPEHDAFGFGSLGVKERRVHLEETIGALRVLFRGESWPGGEFVAEIDGPLLPPPITPGGPPVWVGGQADAVVRLAARVADAWNGWGLHVPEFARKVAVLREASDEVGRIVASTWAGIVLVGRDDDEAGRLLEQRYERGMPETNIWAGSAGALIRFLARLGDAGASWTVLVAAGPPDRIELIARAVLPAIDRS